MRKDGGSGRFRCAIGMPRIEWRIWIVLDRELNGLSGRIPRDLGNNAETKIDTGRDATGRDYITILDDTSLFMRGADQWQ